jgi:hypothetical protein
MRSDTFDREEADTPRRIATRNIVDRNASRPRPLLRSAHGVANGLRIVGLFIGEADLGEEAA